MTRVRAASAATVTAVLVKPVPHAPMQPLAIATATARRGLAGDCHSHPLGPRQVLVVRQEALDELGVEAAQVRANLVLAGLSDEDLGSGRVLRVGDARIRITHACEICSVLRSYLDRDTFRRLPGRRGALGVFLAGGKIAVGASVSIERRRYPVVPDVIGDRAAWVIARIPEGRVLTYESLLHLVGGKRAHFRVMPVYVRRAAAAGLPAHRVVTSAGRLSGHVASQAAALRREGLEVENDEVVGARWDAHALFTTAA